MRLFIDTTNWQLCLILFDSKNKIIDSILIKDTKKVSDITMENIKGLISKHNLLLKDIADFYVTQGPGSYTGVRVGLTIVKTLKTINSKINVYLINSLLFQAGLSEAISLLDARSNKWYCGVYSNGKLIEGIKVIDIDQLNELNNKYKNFLCLKDNLKLNPETNLLQLIDHFKKVEKTSEILPIYIKNFI